MWVISLFIAGGFLHVALDYLIDRYLQPKEDMHSALPLPNPPELPTPPAYVEQAALAAATKIMHAISEPWRHDTQMKAQIQIMVREAIMVCRRGHSLDLSIAESTRAACALALQQSTMAAHKAMKEIDLAAIVKDATK